MKAIRFLIFLSVGVALSCIPNYLNYDRYWNQTIYRVQTVDFNILSHTLPTKLSALMIRGENDEIGHVVNSNYGLFWIVVTNCTATTKECPKQNILYTSKSYDDISVSALKGQLFNVLRDPVPIYPEWEFSNPRASEPTFLNQSNFGVPIGRVYYVRNSSPYFIDHLTRGLISITKDPRNLLHVYVVTLGFFLVTALLLWVGCELLWKWHERYQRRHQSRIRIEEQARKRLEERQRDDDNAYRELLDESERNNQQLSSQIADFKEKENQRLAYLERENQRLTQDNERLQSQPDNQEGYLDMSEYRFAIVSGHPTVAERITRELQNKHHVSRIEFIENRFAERRNRLAPRLENVDFVLLQINYGSHSATQAARDLCRGHLIELPRIDNGERLREFIEVKVRIKIMRDRLDELI